MFAPGSVAVIGATGRPGTVGRTILENLLHGSFQRKVYAVNAKHPEVLGLKAYKSIRDISGAVDLAVVATRQRRSRSSLESAWNPGPSPRL
jgi:acetyltransferase